MRRDLLSIVVAGYGAHSAPEWERRVIDAAQPLERGLGVCLHRMEWDGDAFRHGDVVGRDARVSEWLLRNSQNFTTAFPEVARRGFRIENSGKTNSQLSRMRWLRRLRIPPLTPLEPSAPMRDVIGVLGVIDPAAVVMLYVPCPAITEIEPRQVRRLRMVGVHLGAGRRLIENDGAIEAVLDAGGRVLHAEGAARLARQEIRRRAVAIDRARTRVGRADIDRALSVWRGLVAGRWSLVERFESDGRRLMVARKNPPRLARTLALTTTEQRVVELLVHAENQKWVAYTLGLSPAAVSLLVEHASVKLGVRSIGELVAVVRALAPKLR